MLRKVVVRAPATVANIGSGFDCMGFALAWHNLVTVEQDESGAVSVKTTGEGAAQIPAGESNLTVRAARAVLGDVGLRVECVNAVPYGRGMGSSAAAIVAGLVAGTALAEKEGLELLPLATEMEGHADNVAPCLLGGVTIVTGGRAQRLDPPETVRPIVCAAPKAMSTEAARKALPDTVPFSEAVASVGRAASLAAAIATGAADALLEATDDTLHQPARFALMPESAALVRALRAEGIAAFLSGAGPSVAALVPWGRTQWAQNTARHHAEAGWQVKVIAFDPDGATVLGRE
jgi:homoserine kinase